MATPAIQLIEVAMVTAVKAAFAGSNVAVESYAGQLDDEAFAWLHTLPAVWISFDRTTEVRQISTEQYLYAGRFVLLAAARALGPEPERRLGNGTDVGVYQLLEDAKNALFNQTLGLPIEPIVPGLIAPVMQGRPQREAIAVWSQAFSTWWVESAPQPAAPDLVSIQASYYTPPGAAAPAVTDTITLQI